MARIYKKIVKYVPVNAKKKYGKKRYGKKRYGKKRW